MTLTDDGAELVAAIDAWTTASADRAEYRHAHGRTLSAEHLAQIKALRDRLGDLLPAKKEALSINEDFERLKAAAGRMH